MRSPKLITLSILICSIYSCSIQKRHYRSGFHIASLHAKADKHQDKFLSKTLPPNSNEALSSSPIALETAPIHKPLKLPSDSCDRLTLLDGREEKIKVLEITSSDIKYKKCDFQDGPTYIVPRADVFMVKYANGAKELFSRPKLAATRSQNEAPQQTLKVKKTTPFLAKISYALSIANATVALVLLNFLSIATGIPPAALIAILVIAAFALVMAIQANNEIKMNKDELKGFGLVIPAIIISSIVLFVFLLLAITVFL
jgi:hypothetical protein